MKWAIDKSNADIGHYTIYFENNDGEEVSGTEISLTDYTNNFQKYRHIDGRNIGYYWTWCYGYSHSEEYTMDECHTVEEAIEKAKNWVKYELIGRYNTAMKVVEKLSPIIQELCNN